VRLLLVVNVNAQTVTPRRVSVIEHALASEFKVEIEHTKRQGHAMHVARGAVHEGFDLVAAMGGDGTVNEVANGLAESPVPLAIIPGGGTNVLARSFGIPNDPVEATGHLLAIRNNPPRRIPLGRADGRYFTFTCGMGFDGAIVRAVERRQGLKRTGGQGFYIWSGVRLAVAYPRREPPVTVRWGQDLEQERDGLFLAIAQNNRPFTFLGDREVNICPRVELDGGLDLLAFDRFRILFILRMFLATLGSGRHIRNRHALYLHDEERIELTSEIPLPVQMDGEYIGERTSLTLEAVPGALSVLY
jgi:diacylglycerol kinase family enzyme